MNPQQKQRFTLNNTRFGLWYGFIIFILAIFIVRLFYIQVIEHQQYKQAALRGQLKEYEIPAERGVILAHDGPNIVPIVLNERVYTLFADPIYITDKKKAAKDLAIITGGKAEEYETKMNAETRYAVLEKLLREDVKNKIDQLELKGIGLREGSIRTYPQGDLAAQLLGFVNDDGEGKYGVEQALDDQLRGKPGLLKAITDSRGVPLVSNEDNVLKDPEPGKRLELTIDIGIQRRAEQILKEHLKSLSAESGTVVVMNPNNGAINAIANYPSYNPANFRNVSNPGLFNNAAVSSPLEVGSIMKTLTVGAALNEGVVSRNTTFYDPGRLEIDGEVVSNVDESGGAATRNITDILRFSLNTGAVYLLKQLGGGEINEKGRKAWHDYLVNHYNFGKKTGIEQGYESEGTVPDPNEGFGLNIKYANTVFGQGLLITPVQMCAAFSATINGGKYFQPHLVEPGQGNPVVVKNDKVIKKNVSAELRLMHQENVDTHYRTVHRSGYKIGGKTGTAQIANPNGGYYKNKFIGTFIGYIGGDKPEYVIMVRVNEPKISGYAGSAAASPLFAKISDMLINNFSVPRAN